MTLTSHITIYVPIIKVLHCIEIEQFQSYLRVKCMLGGKVSLPAILSSKWTPAIALIEFSWRNVAISLLVLKGILCSNKCSDVSFIITSNSGCHGAHTNSVKLQNNTFVNQLWVSSHPRALIFFAAPLSFHG